LFAVFTETPAATLDAAVEPPINADEADVACAATIVELAAVMLDPLWVPVETLEPPLSVPPPPPQADRKKAEPTAKAADAVKIEDFIMTIPPVKERQIRTVRTVCNGPMLSAGRDQVLSGIKTVRLNPPVIP
jgi:hypothetical protein